jgi:hypothetical protein
MKRYIDGGEYLKEDFIDAKQILINENIYQKMNNFGPFTEDKKLDKFCRKIDEFILDKFKFTIVEYECINFGLNSGISSPRIEKAAWFQLLNKR